MYGAERSAERIVREAYDRAGEYPGCDPRHLAYGLGLLPCPCDRVGAGVEDGFLLYPEALGRRDRGLAMFSAIARWLILSPIPLVIDVRGLTAELVVPASMVRYASVATIHELQAHAPIPFLHFALSAHGSGRFRRNAT